MNLITFKRPRLAIAALVALAFVVIVTAVDMAHVDKYGWLMASGLGTFFIMTGGKAIKNRYGNLAVLLFVSGIAMWLCGILMTDGEVFGANILNDSVPTKIGAIGGMFTGVEDEHDT